MGKARRGKERTINMKNRTDMVGVGVGERMRQAVCNQQKAAQLMAWGIFSYIISAGNMLDGLSPFGVAMVAACPQQFLAATAIGATGGSLFPAGVAMSMKYAAACLIAAVARWSLLSGRLMKQSFWTAPVLAGVSFFSHP